MAPHSPVRAPAPATALRRALLGWYDRNRRVLPWRAAPGERADPYAVWISEIMLQQTRVTAAIPYYQRFLHRFPDAAALGAAAEAEVLAAWSGLGYYRRARQLHQAAQQIVALHRGVFPLDPEAARALPGIGAYTAGAILSIAGNLRLPAVDGNVVRIAERLCGCDLTLHRVRELAAAWLAPRRPGDFNQALMDLGATVCTPRQPACGSCPLRSWCASREAARPSRQRPAAIRVELHYTLARRGDKVFLRQRPADAAQMAGMWELPEAQAAPRGESLGVFRHAITTRAIRAHVYAGAARGAGRWMDPAETGEQPLTGLSRKILHRLLAWPLRN